MARGNNGQKVFVSDKDYEAFLDQLRVVRGRYPFYLYAYALMPNWVFRSIRPLDPEHSGHQFH